MSQINETMSQSEAMRHLTETLAPKQTYRKKSLDETRLRNTGVFKHEVSRDKVNGRLDELRRKIMPLMKEYFREIDPMYKHDDLGEFTDDEQGFLRLCRAFAVYASSEAKENAKEIAGEEYRNSPEGKAAAKKQRDHAAVQRIFNEK